MLPAYQISQEPTDPLNPAELHRKRKHFFEEEFLKNWEVLSGNSDTGDSLAKALF